MNEGTFALARCSDLSERHTLAGSAPTTARWWLVESTGPWGARPIREASQEWLRDWSTWDPESARVLLVRPHGRVEPSDLRRIWTFQPGDRQVMRRQIPWGSDPGIDGPHPSPDQPGWTTSLDHPRVVICTNGRRDRCCAERGRALLDTLDGDRSTQAWECTHVGGHRFAPTGLTIPEGIVLGRLSPTDLESIIGQGDVDLDCVRGRSDLDAPTQVAELAVRRLAGSGRLADRLEILHSTAHEDAATVALRDPGGVEYSVGLRRIELPALAASCGAAPTPGSTWTVVSGPLRG